MNYNKILLLLLFVLALGCSTSKNNLSTRNLASEPSNKNAGSDIYYVSVKKMDRNSEDDIYYMPIKRLKYQLKFDEPVFEVGKGHYQFTNIHFLVEGKKYLVHPKSSSLGICKSLGFSQRINYSDVKIAVTGPILGMRLVDIQHNGHLTKLDGRHWLGSYKDQVTCSGNIYD